MKANGPAYFTFLAQSLDNANPDIISVNGIVLSDDDLRSPERIDVVDRTTLISSRGVAHASKGKLARGFVNNGCDVLIEVASAERDIAGRIAPILCLGDLRDPTRKSWTSTLVRELTDFARRAGRRLGPNEIDGLHDVAERILAESRRRELADMVAASAKKLIGWQPSKSPTLQSPAESSRDEYEEVASLISVSDSTLEVDPKVRRIVVVVSSTDRRRYAADQNLRRLVSEPFVTVVEEPLEPPDSGTVGRHLYDLELLSAGSTLVQNPYDSKSYFRVETAEIDIMRAKIHTFLRLCQLLGAQSVTVESKDTFKKSGSSDTQDEGRMRKKKVSSEQSESVINRLSRELKYGQEYQPTAPDCAAARQFLETSRIVDQDLLRLVDAAEIGRIRRMTVSLNTEREIDELRHRLSKVSGSLSALEFSRRRSGKSEIQVSFNCEIEFGDSGSS